MTQSRIEPLRLRLELVRLVVLLLNWGFLIYVCLYFGACPRWSWKALKILMASFDDNLNCAITI